MVVRLAATLTLTVLSFGAQASSLEQQPDQDLILMRAKIDRILASRLLQKNQTKLTRPNSLSALTPSSGPPPELTVEKKPPQNLFIRSDPLDGLALPFEYPYLMDGKGASISFSGNQIANTQSFNTNSFLALRGDPILVGNATFGYGIFTYLNGALSNPLRPASERNALQTGIDLQAAYSKEDFSSLLVAGLRPYFQTDFRGYAQIGGFNLTVEPYHAEDIHLGARPSILIDKPQLISWYWRILPEINFFHVSDPGQTSFAANRDYAFIGGTLQLRTLFFDGIGPSWISSRFYMNGSVTQFWDAAARGKNFHDAQLEFGYIISKAKPIEADVPLVTTISAVYNNGVNRLTFSRRDEYKIQLNLQY